MGVRWKSLGARALTRPLAWSRRSWTRRAGTCSQGTTWFGRLSSVADFGLDAHRASECSGAGLCDRATGNCACFAGFEGAACDRVACARKCNSRGVCLTSQQLGLQYGQDTTPGVRGDGAGPVYGDTTTTLGALVWDEHVTQTCVCDLGFSGPDCGEAYCPAGDNPFTEHQQRRAVKLTINLNGGTVANDGTQLGYIQFAGQVSAPLNFGALSTATEQDFIDWFDSLANIFSTRVRVTKTGAGSALVVVVEAVLEFESRRAVWNNLFVFNGNPPLSMFSCDLGSVDDASVLCGFTDIDVMTITHAKNDPSNNLIRIRVTDASTIPNMFAVRALGGMVCARRARTGFGRWRGGTKVRFRSPCAVHDRRGDGERAAGDVDEPNHLDSAGVDHCVCGNVGPHVQRHLVHRGRRERPPALLCVRRPRGCATWCFRGLTDLDTTSFFVRIACSPAH